MIAKAKFKCKEIVQGEYQKQIKMEAINSSKGENESFTKYTPFGKFEMSLLPEGTAYDKFKVGQCYYFDISEAPNE